jgi:hypothetical protein
MLLHFFTDPPGTTAAPDPLFDALQAELAALGGYPSQPRRVAVSNGSGTGADQGFAPGTQLVRYEFGNLFVTLRGNAWAVPDQVSGAVFDGRIRILFSDTQRAVTVSGATPWDGAPGGWRATMAEMDTVAVPYGDIEALHPNHCFIPAVSALALDTADPFHDLAGDPDLLARTPFDAVLWAASNEEHVHIGPATAAWLTTEIERGLVAAPAAPAAVPGGPALEDPAPNPFLRVARLGFTLPRPARARVEVFGADGRRVRTLLDADRAAGRHDLVWDGRDARGRETPPGLYLARLEAEGRSVVRRIAKLAR